jgi:large subunit ribosomal protein L9
MATKLLLIEDVEALGRSGDIVTVKPGYGRNFLLPQGMAVIADKKALRQQERLVEERKKKAVVDKNESDAIAARIEGMTLTTIVKVDHEGHMYGSVTAHEIVDLLQEQIQVPLEKKNIQLKHAIKTTGVHVIPVKLKEGVTASFNLKVMSEEGFKTSQEEQPAAQ